MIRFISVVLFTVLTGAVHAQSCNLDTEGVSRTSHQSTPTVVICSRCRSVQDFPEDSINAMTNFFMTDGTQGAAFRDLFLEEPFLNSLRQVDVPVCNDHGQCGTGTFRVNYNHVGVQYESFTFYFPTTINNYTVTFRDVGGKTTTRIFPPNIGALAVPATGVEDSIPDGECRDSNGATRGSGQSNDDNNAGNGGYDNYDDYPDYDDRSDYWDAWEWGYGGQRPFCYEDPDPVAGGVVCPA